MALMLVAHARGPAVDAELASTGQRFELDHGVCLSHRPDSAQVRFNCIALMAFSFGTGAAAGGGGLFRPTAPAQTTGESKFCTRCLRARFTVRIFPINDGTFQELMPEGKMNMLCVCASAGVGKEWCSSQSDCLGPLAVLLEA